MAVHRKLRMGMIGGGPGAFIGPVHKMGAELDGKIELVAGAFSQSAERSRAAGETYRIDPERAYTDYREMMEAERKRPDGIDFVAIVTPNHLHLPVAEAALALRPYGTAIGQTIGLRDMIDGADPVKGPAMLGTPSTMGMHNYWGDWPRHYDYAIELSFGARPALPTGLERVRPGGFFNIYRIGHQGQR